MQMFTIEMLPNLCKHCAKHHLNIQQQQQQHQHQQQLEKSRECINSANFPKSIWLLLTIARKKLDKIRDLSDNENKQNANPNNTNENTMNSWNVMAYHSNDKYLKCNNTNVVAKTQSIHNGELARNGASVLVAESSKMNIINNDDVDTSCSNGALDVGAQSMRNNDMRLQQQVTLSALDETVTKRSHCMSSLSTLRCNQCQCENSCSSDINDQQALVPNSLDQQNRSFSLNVHETTKNPNSFSEQKTQFNERLATNCSDLNRCNKVKNGIDTNGSSRSVRTVSANYSNNHLRKNAYFNHRWPYAISSTMNFSHVLLICIAFMVFGIRNAMVMADDTPANASQLNLTENGSKYTNIQIYKPHILNISLSEIHYESCITNDI